MAAGPHGETRNFWGGKPDLTSEDSTSHSVWQQCCYAVNHYVNGLGSSVMMPYYRVRSTGNAPASGIIYPWRNSRYSNVLWFDGHVSTVSGPAGIAPDKMFLEWFKQTLISPENDPVNSPCLAFPQ